MFKKGKKVCKVKGNYFNIKSDEDVWENTLIVNI